MVVGMIFSLVLPDSHKSTDGARKFLFVLASRLATVSDEFFRIWGFDHLPVVGVFSTAIWALVVSTALSVDSFERVYFDTKTALRSFDVPFIRCFVLAHLWNDRHSLAVTADSKRPRPEPPRSNDVAA